MNAELRAVLNDLTIDPLQRAQNAAALLVFWSAVSRPHHSGPGAVTLAAGAVPHQIQTVPANAPDSRRAMPGISR